MLKNYAFFQRDGYVSVWIGRLTSDEELDDYLNMTPQFEQDFGFELSETDMPETKVEATTVGVPTLVDGFSWSQSYRESTIQAALALGYDSANTMVVFHNFKYNPSDVTVKPSTKLVFLGTFTFSGM